jgi:hypothetical protein
MAQPRLVTRKREVGISKDIFGDEFERAHDWRILRLLNKDPPPWKTLRQVVEGENVFSSKGHITLYTKYDETGELLF